jgi:hypothetical protein
MKRKESVLEKALKRIDEMPVPQIAGRSAWVPVSERLPDFPFPEGRMNHVLVCWDWAGEDRYEIAGFAFGEFNIGFDNAKPTHWMYLPEPPPKPSQDELKARRTAAKSPNPNGGE